MKCPKCGLRQTSVIDTRSHGTYRTRRRKCNHCGERFTTFEINGRAFRHMNKLFELAQDIQAIAKDWAEEDA